MGSSRLWFTIAQGIVTEVYYPRIDIPQIKDLGFIIADDKGFWVELRRLGQYTVSLAKPGVPAVEIVHRHARFTFTLEVCPSQRRDALLLRYRLEGDEDLRPYALLAARLGDDADDDLAWVARHNGRTRAVGRAGAVRAGAVRGRCRGRRCLAALFGRRAGSQRRLAGFQPQRPHDLGI